MAVIGIAVAEEGIECALVRRAGGALLWSRVTPHDGLDLSESLAVALRELPRPARGARVRIAVGPRWCQLRHLRELPRLKDSVIRSVIAQGVTRFFLRGPSVLATTGVSWTSHDAGWCAAFEHTLVEMLLTLCATHRLTLELVAPLAALNVIEADPSSSPQGRAAARLRRTAPLAYAPRLQPPPASSRELLTVAAALLAALLLCFAAPGITAAVMARRAERELGQLRAVGSPVAEADRALRELQSRARGMERFARGARSHVLLLGHLASALPKHAFVVTLRTDTSGGTAAAISRSVDDALRAFRSLPGVADAQILGATTREDLPSESRQRVNVRFSWASTSGPVATAPHVAAR